MIVLKSKVELGLMRAAGRVNAQVLQAVRDNVRPGISTRELDEIAAAKQQELGALPVFKGYRIRGGPPFPTVTTACVNEELVHGIPSNRILQDGDLLTIDCASNVDGYIGDAAFSVQVGQSTPDVAKMIAVVEEALAVGITQCVVGNRIGDISAAIQTYVESQSFAVVRGYGGHGVGRTMHEDPHIPNYGRPGRGQKLRAGMTIAIEPMILAGSYEVTTLEDEWTVVSRDGKLTAHCEHTVAITDDGPEILTLL